MQFTLLDMARQNMYKYKVSCCTSSLVNVHEYTLFQTTFHKLC